MYIYTITYTGNCVVETAKNLATIEQKKAILCLNRNKKNQEDKWDR